MSTNTPSKDLKTAGIVLRRTNYGEADRILNVITPVGKVSVMARGVRKEKSKLAGGVEMLTLSDYVMHFGKSELGVVTSAKMVRHYGNLLKDYERMELIGAMMKQINRAAEGSDNGEFFEILKQCLEGLDGGLTMRPVEAWFVLNLGRAMGEQMNLYRDISGEKLSADEHYMWDVAEEALRVHENGDFGANEIKLMRLMLTAKLEVISRVKVDVGVMDRVCGLCRLNNASML
jgi:DNA repair protein RecO (recombination protein O)